MSYSNITNKYTFSYGDGISNNCYLDFTQTEHDNDLHDFLGFPGHAKYPIASVGGTLVTVEAPNVVDLTGIPFICLYIKEIGNINYSYSQLHKFHLTTFLIPVITSSNMINIVCQYNTWENVVVLNNKLSLKELTVQLYYCTHDQIYPLNVNGATVSFLLEYE